MVGVFGVGVAAAFWAGVEVVVWDGQAGEVVAAVFAVWVWGLGWACGFVFVFGHLWDCMLRVVVSCLAEDAPKSKHGTGIDTGQEKKDPLRRCATPPPEARGRREDPTAPKTARSGHPD